MRCHLGSAPSGSVPLGGIGRPHMRRSPSLTIFVHHISFVPSPGDHKAPPGVLGINVAMVRRSSLQKPNVKSIAGARQANKRRVNLQRPPKISCVSVRAAGELQESRRYYFPKTLGERGA